MKLILVFILVSCVVGCGKQTESSSSTKTAETSTTTPGSTEPAARFVFHKSNFTDLTDYVSSQHTSFQCLGDVTKTFSVAGADYTGSPTSLGLLDAPDSFSPTGKPAFIKNVSVDITNTYFLQTMEDVVQTDACSYRGVLGTSDPSACADFDQTPSVIPTPTVAPTSSPVPTATPIGATPTPTPSPTPTAYYESGYYRVRDDHCTNQGPVLGGDIGTSKSYVGGVSIDLDRSALGAQEDLLMTVTYHSQNSNSVWPGAQATPAPDGLYPLGSDEAILEVNLIGTNLGLSTLLGAKQPRAWQSFGAASMPIYLKKIATLRDPFGSLRTEQIYVPLSGNALIDRIRIDRVRGSYELYQVDLYRLGNRSN